jgi:hypothetical protein
MDLMRVRPSRADSYEGCSMTRACSAAWLNCGAMKLFGATCSSLASIDSST